MDQMQILEEFRPIIEKLCNQECSIQDAMTFIFKNYEYLKEKDLKENDKFYLIYNNKNLYRIIIVNENEYEWSLYSLNRLYYHDINDINFYCVKTGV